MLRRTLVHHVKQMHTMLKCSHRASCSFVEHSVGNMIKQMALELKVDNEIDTSLVSNRGEYPRIGKVLQWSFYGVHF
jgi:hypothetical protein